MILEVRYEDIEAGVINSRTADPIALAAQRAGLTNVRVGRKFISWEEGFTYGPGMEVIPVTTDSPADAPYRRRVYAGLSDNAVRLLKRLEYGERGEVMECVVKRDKKGNITSIKHKPIFILLGEGVLQEAV